MYPTNLRPTEARASIYSASAIFNAANLKCLERHNTQAILELSQNGFSLKRVIERVPTNLTGLQWRTRTLLWRLCHYLDAIEPFFAAMLLSEIHSEIVMKIRGKFFIIDQYMKAIPLPGGHRGLKILWRPSHREYDEFTYAPSNLRLEAPTPEATYIFQILESGFYEEYRDRIRLKSKLVSTGGTVVDLIRSRGMKFSQKDVAEAQEISLSAVQGHCKRIASIGQSFGGGLDDWKKASLFLAKERLLIFS